jgi:hypothetical protein
MENKFKEGDIVFAIADPKQRLTIRRYIDSIYYCKIIEIPNHKDLVFFERELSSAVIPET